MPLKVNTNEPDGNVVAEFVPALESAESISARVVTSGPSDEAFRACVCLSVREGYLEASEELLRALACADPLAACRLLAEKLRGVP